MKKIILLIFLLSNIFYSNMCYANLSDINNDGVVNFEDLSILSNNWCKTSSSFNKIYCTSKVYDVNSIGTITILDLNDGPCLVTNLWISCYFPYVSRETPMRIYFDNASEPHIEGRMGELFCSGIIRPNTYRSSYMGVTTAIREGESLENAGFSGYNKFFMPYSSSIRIEVDNNSRYKGQIKVKLERISIDPNNLSSIGLNKGMYLRAKAGASSVENSEKTMLETSKPVKIVGMCQYFDGSNFDYLNNDYKVYYDGEDAPSYICNTESFYNSSWGFQEGLFQGLDENLVFKDDEDFSIIVNKFFPLYKAIGSEDGLKFTWQACSDVYTRWLIWYYE